GLGIQRSPPMTRGRWIEKLATIISRVEAGHAPARIREIYIFGSFARGALEPNDLDLIVIHDEPGEEILAPLLRAVKSYSYDELDQSLKAYGRFQAAMRKVCRRGGERMDIKLAETLSPTATGSGPPRGWWACTARPWSATAGSWANTLSNSTTSSGLFPPRIQEVQLDEKWSFAFKKQ